MTVDALLARLAALPDCAARREALARSRIPPDAALVERLSDEVARLARVDLQKAERLGDLALSLAESLADDYALGRSLRARGHTLALSGRSADALAHYERAIECFQRGGRDVEEAITRSGALQVLIYLGRYEHAYAWAALARSTFKRHRDHLRLARLDTNVGNILHRQDRFTEALDLYRCAYRTLARRGSPQDVAIALRNIAVCLISLNEFDSALRTHRAARRHCERHNLVLLASEADYNIAYLYYLRGEYARAIELYEVTRRRCERVGDRYHQALCDLDQSELSLELNLTDDAIRLGSLAFEQFEELKMNYEAAKALTWRAIGLAHDGDARGALAGFNEAQRRFQQERNRPWLALIDLYRALVFLEGQDQRQATRLAESALSVFAREGLSAKAAMSELVLARAALRGGDATAAKTRCLSALQRLQRTEAPALRFQAQFVLAQVYEGLADEDASAQAYLDAHASLEALRSDLRAEETKIAFLEDKLVIYESAVAMALAGNRRVSATDAFTLIEQAKSRSLSDLLAFRSQILPRRGRARSAGRRLHQLRESLNWCYREIDVQEFSGEPDAAARVETLRTRSRRLEGELTKALSEIRVTDREYASLQNAGPTDLATIQASLPDNAVLLEYYAARGHLCVCVIDRTTFELVPLGPVERVRNISRLLQFQLGKFRLSARYQRLFATTLAIATRTHLQDLYRELIEPVAERLIGRAVTIVPHDFLHYVPFHALFDGRRHLIDGGPITYAPSASVYHLCRVKRLPVRRGRPLVLGVPDRAAPQIDAEVEAVGSTLRGARVYRGRDASAARLRTEGAHSPLIHVAAHGKFRLDNPMFSAIQLGDGPFSLFDLYDLDIEADLITLSGCGTGLNALVGGDELLGLVRGCLYAGARGVLVSLWDVNDRSTAEMMRIFYQRLRSSTEKADALRDAMLELRERYPHPYYWAPFILVGSA